jgi:hypothetical protein
VTLKNARRTLITPDGLAALEQAVDIGIAALRRSRRRDGQDLAITVDYMNTRKQFGVAISSFQALRHRMADMKMQLELARSMSYYASLKLNEAGRRAPPRAGPRQVPAGCRCASWASRRCSCTAASA